MRTFKSQTRAMDLEARAKTDFDFHQLIVEFSEISIFSRPAFGSSWHAHTGRAV